jgi:ABC-2 type transport system ATP-binding protein
MNMTKDMSDETNAQQVILETRDLSRNFEKVKAVNSISMNIYCGEIFGLLGPNGAGKTTLIKMLTTLLPPSAGDAFICGVSLVHAPTIIRNLIGYVPQLISADGSLTGYENLLIFAKLYDIPRAKRKHRIEEALKLMGLTEVANRFVKEYSGGMIRRLEIVQAMLHRPRLLFLDEPTSGLDPVARKVVWEHLIQAHYQYDMTILLTTHDMEEADLLCQRIAIMNHGQILVTDSPAALKNKLNVKTLDDVFIHYIGSNIELDNRETYREIARQRKTEHRRS